MSVHYSAPTKFGGVGTARRLNCSGSDNAAQFWQVSGAELETHSSRGKLCHLKSMPTHGHVSIQNMFLFPDHTFVKYCTPTHR